MDVLYSLPPLLLYLGRGRRCKERFTQNALR